MADDGTSNITITTNEEWWVLSSGQGVQLWLDEKEKQKGKDKNLWGEWKEIAEKIAEKTAAYYSTGLDINTVRKLSQDLGTMLGRVYFKDIQGKPHIIIKGYPGLRQVLTNPKYGVNNPKVVSMGLGKAGALKSIKDGGILTIVLVTAYDVIDYLLTDSMTLADLVGQIAGDVIKIAAAAGIAAVVVAAGLGTFVTSFALGPLLAAIVITVGVGLILDWIDDKLGLTKKLKAMLAPMLNPVEDAMRQQVQQAKEQVQQTKDGLIDWAYQGLCAFLGRIIEQAGDRAARYLWRKIGDLLWYRVPSA